MVTKSRLFIYRRRRRSKAISRPVELWLSYRPSPLPFLTPHTTPTTPTAPTLPTPRTPRSTRATPTPLLPCYDAALAVSDDEDRLLGPPNRYQGLFVVLSLYEYFRSQGKCQWCLCMCVLLTTVIIQWQSRGKWLQWHVNNGKRWWMWSFQFFIFVFFLSKFFVCLHLYLYSEIVF